MKYLWLFLVLMLSISGVLGIQVDEKIVSNVIVNDFEARNVYNKMRQSLTSRFHLKFTSLTLKKSDHLCFKNF